MTQAKNHRQLVFDTETTGLGKGHRILEIGIVEMIDRKITGQEYQQLINPERTIEVVEIHGITQEKVADAPVFAEIIDELLAYINGDELIVHHADFDVSMMNDEFARLNEKGGMYRPFEEYASITDSLRIAQRLYKGSRNSLDALCDRLKVDRSGRDLHNAVLDCRLLAEVYLRMTGGQKSLFGDVLAEHKHILAKPLNDYSKLELPNVMVSAEELARHEAFMQELQS